ncbi:uncharacterized protein LOC124146548 [Haliotis rufescens]|uniref:uncharacterized protein LOC124146548 n=1 Tax=Haliotis rufescens TaxID=6454 RepID=UPI00201EE81E|nr:uncharacterized protein LOC124146548 [Haliotis rufescens]
MSEWTCGRCTFINHELMANCELCEAPKEAAELRHLDNTQQGEDMHVDRTERPPDSAAIPEDPGQPPAEGTAIFDRPTEGGSTNGGLSTSTGMAGIPPDQTQQTDRQLMDSMGSYESGFSTPADQLINGSQEGTGAPVPGLPEPLAPMVVHSTNGRSESPMSEPEEIEAAMCLPSPETAEKNQWSFLDNEVRMVLLGKTGVGKSTTGNNILSSKTFKSSASGASITRKCQLGWGSRFGRELQIIDTPGLFDTGMTNEAITQEVVKCIGMTSPGPHAFVLVIRLDRFTQEENDTVNHFLNIFGKEMLSYLIVLFTRMDDLKHDGVSLDEYVRDVPENLKKLLENCQHRYLGIDNRGTDQEKEKDVQNLLQAVDSMVKANGGGHYTNEMYEEAERIFAEHEEKHIKIGREKMMKEMEKLREEAEEELRLKEEERERKLETMKGKLSELGIREEDEEWVHVFGNQSLSPVEENTRMSLGPAAQASQQMKDSAVPISEEAPPAVEKQRSEGSMTERRPGGDSFKADGASVPAGVSGVSLGAQAGSFYNTDSSHSTQRESVKKSFIANEPQYSFVDEEPHDPQRTCGSQKRHDEKLMNEADRLRREASILREDVERINREHERERERMRSKFITRQGEALESFKKQQHHQRQEMRQQMENANSGMFKKFFRAMKNALKKVTDPIARGFQSIFAGVERRSGNDHDELF